MTRKASPQTLKRRRWLNAAMTGTHWLFTNRRRALWLLLPLAVAVIGAALLLAGCRTFPRAPDGGGIIDNKIISGQDASNWTFFVVAIMLAGFGAWSIWSKRFFEGALLIGGAVLVAAAPFVLADLLVKFDLPLKVGAWAALVLGIAIVISRQAERFLGRRSLVVQAKAIREKHPEGATALLVAAQPARYLRNSRAKENRKALAASIAGAA